MVRRALQLCVRDGREGELCVQGHPRRLKSGNFSMALNSYVFRLDTDPATGNITAAVLRPRREHPRAAGEGLLGRALGLQHREADAALGGWHPYNPATVTGSLGRGATQNGGGTGRSVTGTLNIGVNAYPAGNVVLGPMAIYDFADDNVDHTGMAQPGLGGAFLSVGGYAGGGPSNISSAAGASPNNIGSADKATQKEQDLYTTTTVSLNGGGVTIPTTYNNVDLDPVYNDHYGDPLARYTYDYGTNPVGVANLIAPMLQPILQKCSAATSSLAPRRSWADIPSL